MTQGWRNTPGRRSVLGAAVIGSAAVALPTPAQAAPGRGHGGAEDLPVPTVIGHRGASGYRPE
ncbi:glycerophosphodiester phosphodiesterase, partial [Streptomyces sp. NPDC087850]